MTDAAKGRIKKTEVRNQRSEFKFVNKAYETDTHQDD